MFRQVIRFVSLAAGLGIAHAWAGDAALVLRNDNYRILPDLESPSSLRKVDEHLRGQGFETYDERNEPVSDMLTMARYFADALDSETDRVLVVLTGHFATALRGGWMYGTDSGNVNSLELPRQALSLNALMDLLAEHPGKAVMIVGLHEEKPEQQIGVRPDLHGLRVPQGVTLIRTPVDKTRQVIDAVLTPDLSMAEIAETAPDGVHISGFVASDQAFTGGSAPPENADQADLRERAFFLVARDLGTVEALLAYVKRYPDGRFVGEANDLVHDLREQPVRQAEAIESALDLTRTQRRRIQENLTLLGFGTRGVDGVFGRGTRAAIASWQRSEGLPETGYLTQRQIDTLENKAERRRDRIADEERRKKAEREAQDRAYWQDTGALGTEAGLKAYLGRYPDGLYADLAEAQLDQIEAALENENQAQARRAWAEAKEINTVQGYEAFLRDYPDSRHSEKAIRRLKELGGVWVTQADIDRAKEEERRRMGNPVTRMLVEQRLASLGHRPGRIDGGFTDQTRSAIKSFQRANDILPTGHVDKVTLDALLP